MGVDIHCFVECKDKETGKWFLANPAFPNSKWGTDGWNPSDGAFNYRNYDLFSILAGVRGPYRPMNDPCGVPNDMSDELQKIYDDDKDWCFGFTWYDLKDMRALYEEQEDKWGWEPDEDNPLHALANFMSIVEYIVDMNGVFGYNTGEARVIMWFDC